MDQSRASIGDLEKEVMDMLAKMLDNNTCGWRHLAAAASEQPKLLCSEMDLTSCSLQALSATGSPGRSLLALLADRSCSQVFLLQCLKKIGHQGALQLLTATERQQICVTVQPNSLQAAAGSTVVLTCRASGPPALTYQWFKGKEEVLEATGSTPELVLRPLGPQHQGSYICRVNHGDTCCFSHWARVRLVYSPVGTGPGTLFSGSASGLRVIYQPQCQALSEGDTLLLECNAVANPPPQYQWYHNSAPVPNKTQLLKIASVTTAHRGQYRCKVFNLYHEMWSDPATVSIGPTSITDLSWVEVDRGSESNELERSVNSARSHPPQPQTKNFYATDKVALLIGNLNYRHLNELCAPMADVHELSNLLRQMDFKVVSLLDLNLQEMHSAVTEFLLLLGKGVYGLLYFAGHGYENYGNSFMVPIDAPASYTSEHCLCVQNILTRMQEKETGLNVFLLDMCRKRNPNDGVAVQSGLVKVTANIVFGYATCVDAEAYEVKREDVSNGIFISFLKRRVCEDEKVTVMLDRVAEDMGRFEITRGRQALELRSNLSERRSLTDKIQTSECSAAYSARNLQWAVAHALPKSRFIHFDCGVKVQLGFAAEFSNVMVIYTRILDKPKEICSCSAQLTDFPEDVDMDLKKSNQETLLEAGSLLLIKEHVPSPQFPTLYTHIQSLQRLQKELTFSVCLHYVYSDMEEEVAEKRAVTVGKPLVSKLNLYEPRPAASVSFDSGSVSELSSLSEDFASNTWSLFTPVNTDKFNDDNNVHSY
ncbi:MALT paracaspase 2 [Nerophis lumbriciformis]|uniref:MALT paracaspase 2 n=1 Tax=Nerophis lumbriciformis TaxID=546530 RepID=UPI002AE0ABDC|nr:mucosa-associated lymphoid tissue lymphoma translocation protein 1-like [Nerophis lumbriciformis]